MDEQKIPAEQVIAVIPARHGSSRFPGKPLALLAGRPLVAHVVKAALGSSRVGSVLVATDHRGIADAARKAGAEAFLTQGEHSTGSDRIGEAIQGRSERVILNIQGDEPLVPSGAIDSLVELLESNPQAAVSTLACSLEADSPEHLDPNVVKVVCDDEGRALYFSRAPIPGCHPTAMASQRQAHRHVGLYGFRRDAFEEFLGRKAGQLERAEGLEQLRFLVAGQTIVVGTLDAVPPGVDTPEDLARCAALLRD